MGLGVGLCEVDDVNRSKILDYMERMMGIEACSSFIYNFSTRVSLLP